MGQWFLEGTKEVKVEEREIRLSYYLTDEEMQSTGGRAYGIVIEKAENGLETEREATGGLSECREIVQEILHKMMEGTVTPVALPGVADDLVTAMLCS